MRPRREHGDDHKNASEEDHRKSREAPRDQPRRCDPFANRTKTVIDVRDQGLACESGIDSESCGRRVDSLMKESSISPWGELGPLRNGSSGHTRTSTCDMRRPARRRQKSMALTGRADSCLRRVNLSSSAAAINSPSHTKAEEVSCEPCMYDTPRIFMRPLRELYFLFASAPRSGGHRGAA